MESRAEKLERQNEYTRRYRKRHPDRVKDSRRQVYIKRRHRVLEKIGGAFCVECRCDEIEFLEINHINGGGSEEWRKNRASLTDSILSGKRSTEGLNVLCRVCNAAHHLYMKKNTSDKRFFIKWAEHPQKS